MGRTSAFSGSHSSSGMALARSDAGLEKEGAVLGDWLASADCGAHHCNLADTTHLGLHAHKDIRLLSLSRHPYPLWGQVQRQDTIDLMELAAWYPRVSIPSFRLPPKVFAEKTQAIFRIE